MCCTLIEEYNAYIHYHNDLYAYTLAKNPSPVGHEIYNFLSPYHTDATF